MESPTFEFPKKAFELCLNFLEGRLNITGGI